MKKIIVVFVSVFISTSAIYSQDSVKVDTASIAVKAPTDSSAVNDAKISFETDLHDFGDIEYAGDGTFEFKFKNTGTTPLIISKAKGSCGCTVPTYPKDVPIQPGETQIIKVTYDTKRVGHFMKTVKVTSNAKTEVKVITIRGKVLAEVKEEVFPANGKPTSGAIPFE